MVKDNGMQETEEPTRYITTSRKLFARQVKKYRKNKGWRLEELRAATGLSYNYLSTVENAKANIAIDNADAIANALGVPLFVLLIDQ